MSIYTKKLPFRAFVRFCLFLQAFLVLILLNAKAEKYIWNEYSGITRVFNADSSDLDSVRVTHPGLFDTGDTVMFIQVKGVEIYSPPPNTSFTGKIEDPNNTGIYVLMLVSKISGDIIQFSDPLPFMDSQIPGEVNQLVKVRGARKLHIPAGDTLTCKPWDIVDSTGGVVVILATESITVDGIIYVSGRGFHGGDTIPNEFVGTCAERDPLSNGHYLLEQGSDSSGYKGEGIVFEGYPYVRGDGFVANAGGGGNGMYSGGGGGGNLGIGGTGGYQSRACSLEEPVNFKQGGSISTVLYTNSGILKNRIFMGGGGGTGTMNRSLGKIGSEGGNGGGIIILITDTLISNNGILDASGGSVIDTATAGAGGAGGGGVIVLAVDKYMGDIEADVSGGNGGWTNDPVDETGPGGFGGGGVIWHSLNELPPNINENTSNGLPGEWTNGMGGGAIWGTQSSSSYLGGIRDSLIIPIRGFTFNILYGSQDICEGEAPDTIHASYPKGDIAFNFTWLQWRESTGWTLADGVNDRKDYYAGALTDTTHYRRVVEAVNNGTVDTSEVYKINVLDALYNNAIGASDTICYGLAPATLVHDAGGAVGGGDLVNYDYIWESNTVTSDPEDPNWISAGVNAQNYGPGPLTDTTHFRRILYSHVCFDTSNMVTQTVLPLITGNTTAGNDALICHDEDPGLLNAGDITGGDGAYAYLWEMSNDLEVWTGLADTPDYSPGALTDTDSMYYYRRTVYSGGDDSTCVSISDTVTVQVHPRIEFNWLKPAADTVCEGILPGRIDPDGTIAGGDNIYHYTWEKSIDQDASWNITGTGDTLASYTLPPLTTGTWYRRIVNSGACTDTSEITKYLVHPKINNNLVDDNDTICFGEQPVPFVQAAPPITGALGAGTYSYAWLARAGTGPWSPAGGTDDNVGYAPGSLTDTTWFIRVVASGKCSDTSNAVEVIVQADISNNIIEGGSPTGEACEGLQKSIGGAQPAGGDNALYTYLWQSSLTGSGTWSDAPPANDNMEYLTDILTDTTDFRRLVASGVCRDTSTAVTVRVNPRPQGSITSDPGLEACYYGDVPIRLDVPVSVSLGEPPFTIYYHDGSLQDAVSGYNQVTGTFPLDLTTDDSTLFTIVLDSLQDAKGCWSWHPDSLQGEANALIYRYPEPQRGDDTATACADNVVLPASGSVGEGTWGPANAAYSFSPPDQAPSIFSTTFTNDTLFYTVVWSERNGICPVNDTSVVIVVELYEEPDPADAGTDSTIFFAGSARLWAEPATAGTGTWTVSGSAIIVPEEIHMNNALVDMGSSDLDETIDNAFTWTIINGACPETGSSVLVTRRNIKQYSGFSPDNGDLINNCFVLPGLEYAEEFTMNILNRKGVVIRAISKAPGQEFDDPGMWWDGLQENGQQAPDGTYFYILVVKHAGQEYEYKGYIELVRNMVN